MRSFIHSTESTNIKQAWMPNSITIVNCGWRSCNLKSRHYYSTTTLRVQRPCSSIEQSAAHKQCKGVTGNIICHNAPIAQVETVCLSLVQYLNDQWSMPVVQGWGMCYNLITPRRYITYSTVPEGRGKWLEPFTSHSQHPMANSQGKMRNENRAILIIARSVAASSRNIRGLSIVNCLSYRELHPPYPLIPVPTAQGHLDSYPNRIKDRMELWLGSGEVFLLLLLMMEMEAALKIHLIVPITAHSWVIQMTS